MRETASAMHPSANEVPDTSEIERYLAAHETKALLRFITCGSVDDGKSTLIGRLLFDSKQIFEDQLGALEVESKTYGTLGDGVDLALLVDGLQAEREQGITIDVAYRFFATDKRKFIVADTPGHEQYTRNMATGASNAELAVVLVDARKGLLTQTRRHTRILALLGIRHVILAVNKMDLVGYAQATFEQIAAEYRVFAGALGVPHITCVPVCARDGDNIYASSTNMTWYQGPTLLSHLETVDVAADREAGPFRFPVQWVNRPDADFRGYAGTVASGSVRVGDRIAVLPAQRETTVARIVTHNGDLEEAVSGQAVTLTLADEIDISRGDVIAAADAPAQVTDQAQAHILWMHDDVLLPGREYEIRLGTATARASVNNLRYKVNVNTDEHLAATTLGLNELAVCNLSLDRPLAYDPYAEVPATGGFILVDRFSNATVAMGLIDYGLRRSTNIVWHELTVDRVARARLKGANPCLLWFTGLSGAGKSTIANRVEQQLHALGLHTYTLDGDNVRHGLNRDLGFTDVDRVENIRRVGEVARLFVDAGLIVLVSFISPFRSERDMARRLVGEGEFFEVFVDAPLAVAELRDPKGLYKKARAGEIPNFTGISSPYEPPEAPEIHLDTTRLSPEEAANAVVETLRDKGFF